MARQLDPRGRRVEDLVQAGMLGVCQAAARYDPERDVTFWACVRPRALGSMLDTLNADLSGVEFRDPGDLPEVAAVPGHDPATFAEMLEGLSEKERDLLTLRYRDGLPQEQVAACWGETQKRVSRLETRALTKLRGDPETRRGVQHATPADDDPRIGFYRYPAGGGYRVTRKPLRD